MTLVQVRAWIADDLDRLAVLLWQVAHRLRPVDNGPRCPDCQIGPDVGDNCPVCEERAETQRIYNDIDRAAYAEGYRRAMEVADNGPF